LWFDYYFFSNGSLYLRRSLSFLPPPSLSFSFSVSAAMIERSPSSPGFALEFLLEKERKQEGAILCSSNLAQAHNLIL
jgi:hypothetical protein